MEARMFYKDEARPHNVCYADSPDLYQWETKGNAVTDRNGEGEKCIHWQGKYWLLADTDHPWGQAVWSSDDCTHWLPQDSAFYGSHGDIVISGGRAWWFYFGGQPVEKVNWAVIPSEVPMAAPTNAPMPALASGKGMALASTNTTNPRRSGRRGITINVTKIKVINGKLMFTNPCLPTDIDLKSEREEEK